MARLRASALPLLALLVTACGTNEGDPTPTQPPPGDPPGQTRTVGAVVVAFVEGYNLQTGQPGGTDVVSTGVGAGFVDPESEGGGAGSVPFPAAIPLPEGGIALDTCAPLDLSAYLSGDARRAPELALGLAARLALSPALRGQPAEETPALPLVAAGDAVDLILGAGTVSIPLVKEEDLPGPLQGQPLPPFYLLAEEGLNEDLFDPAATYGLAAPGGDAFPAFSAAPFFGAPQPMAPSAPDALLGEGDVALDAALDFSWSPGAGSYALIDLHALTGEGIFCFVVDDGAFTLPAADLALLPPGEGLLTLGRFSFAQSEIRLNERLAGVGLVATVAQVQMD